VWGVSTSSTVVVVGHIEVVVDMFGHVRMVAYQPLSLLLGATVVVGHVEVVVDEFGCVGMVVESLGVHIEVVVDAFGRIGMVAYRPLSSLLGA
jgi:hypothetical protein